VVSCSFFSFLFCIIFNFLDDFFLGSSILPLVKENPDSDFLWILIDGSGGSLII